MLRVSVLTCECVCLLCAVSVSSGDAEDEEGTIEEQEDMEGSMDHRAELDELQQEGLSVCCAGEGWG